MPLQLKSEGELLNSSPSGDGGSKKKILTLKSEEELIPTNESKTNYVFGKGTTSLQDPLKYDFQTKTGIDNQELAAQSQGRIAKLGAGLVNTASSLVLDGLKDASYLLDFEQVGNLAKGTEQEFGNWFGDLMEQAKEASHMDVFRTKDSLGFHPESAGWWADAMPSIASGLSMIAPALGATKLISGAGKLTGMSKVMRGLGIAEEATAGITGAVVSRYMENTMEGKQTFDSTYQQAIAKGLSEEEAIAKAGEAARQNWTTNSAMLLQDIPQYMSFFKGFKGISAMLGESNKALGTAAKVGLTMGSEAAEEGFQFISDKEATRSALLDNKEVGKDNTFSDRMKDYMQDPEFWNSTFLGAIGGGIFEGVSQFKEGKRQRTYDSTLAMHKAVLTGDKPGYYRAQDNQFNDTTLEHLQKGTLDSFKDQLLFLKNNPERIEDPQERAEVMQRLDSKIQDLEYIEDLQKKLTLDKTKSNELKGLEIGASLSQRLAENRLRSVNLEINKANGEVIQTLSELPPDVIAYKQAKLTLDGMKQIEGLESKSKLLETNINNTAKDLVAAYPNLFESIEELNKTITTTADNTLVNLNKSKQIELKSIEESKDILFQINDPSKQKDLEEHITKLKEEAKKKEEERLKKEKAASGTPTDETEETTSTTSSTEQFAPGSQVQFRGQGQSVEVEDFDVEEGLVKIKGDDVLHPITDFYVPKTLPSTGPEVLNNTDLTQPYTGEPDEFTKDGKLNPNFGTGIHATGTKAAVQEILNTVSDITPITRVRLTKKVSVEGNIQRGLNHLLGKLPSSVKATLSPNKALDVVYELQTPDGTWIDAFHGRHSDQYVTVDEKGNTSTFRFTDNNRTQAKTLFKIREGDADNKKVRDLTDEEITDLINNQHKLDALNKVYQSIYNTQGETTLSAKELNEKYGITVFAKKGKFDTIKDDAVKPILSEISKANIDGEFYIFDKLNGSTWEELQLLGNPNNKDKSKELLSKVKNPNNFIGATNSRYLALGREANGELFLFGIDTQIFTNDQLSPIISNILQHKKFKNGKWEYSEKTKIGETERNEINDELSELIHIIAPTGTKLELKLDVSKDGQPSKLQIKEHTPAKANTEGYNKDGEKYYDIPLSKKTSINSIVTHANEKGLKYIHPESFRRSIPKTENTDKIPTKELAGMFLSNVSKNVFKYSKIIVDLNIPSEDIFGKILPAETKVAPTTVTPKSQSISANTIKDQIAALEDKIANSSSEEEANSYFIEIEALEKQLLEGRKLESDIDRLRGETPINKISQQSAQTFIDFPEAEANVRKLISPASVVNFDDINTLITNIENKGETWGFFAGKSIYLNKAAQKGTEFHEVFHYVFRRLISDEQIRRLHMLARVKYGTPTIKQLSELKNQSNANKSLRKDQLEELWLEEKMADTFMNYKLGKNKLENMGLIGKILSKIQDFLTWLVGHKTELQALFENINKGSFRSDITHYNQFTKKWANPVFKQIPNGEKDTETGKRYTYTGLEEGRQIIRTIAAKVISAKMGTSKARMDVDILLDAAIAKAYQFNSLENNKDIIASKSPIEGLKIKRWLRSQQFVYSNPTSVALIKEQVKKQLDVFNFDKVDLDEEITATENERKLIDFDKNAINIGGFDSLNKEIRAYIGTTLYDTTDALGRPVKTAVDPQVVYQSIMKTLASTDTGNMMNKFRIFAENNQQTKAVYDRLTSETGYDETIGVAKLNPQLLQQFLNAFTTEKIKYLQILPNLETQTYKVFDANNAGKAQVDQWEKNFSETKDLTKSKIALQDAGSDLATGNIDKIEPIKKALASIGVDVSDTYIRYSLLAISDPFNPLIANFKDVKPLTRDDLSALAGILAKDNSPYEKGTKGAITRLQNIAQANYVFDEQVVSPNFQDANGETRYSYIKPSLMLERTRELRQALSTPEGRKAFIEQLNTSYSHSYAFNDNNYLLTHKNADEIFSNLQLEFTGDIRQDKKGQEGTTFKGIDDRSFKLMQYGLFSAQKKIGDVTFAKFYPKVLEASASAYSIKLPVEKLYSNGRPTDRAINLLYDQFLQEVERITITEREINNPDVVKIKDYHIGKLRGLHLFYFKYLENTKLGEQILSKAKNYVSKADFHDMEEAIKTEIETNLLNEIKQENQLLEDLGITSQNLLPKNVSTKDDIGNFYVNSLININAYNDLIEMNPAFSKDAVDNVKRAKRAISAKVSFGKGNHIVGFYKEPKAKGLTKDIDVADAQAMIDMNHFKFILQREGKLSPEIFSILNKIDDGEELTWDEILTLKDKQVMLNSIKTVTSGPVDYHKMSDLILTKKLTSVKNDKGEWVAKPGKELLHNFRVQLENLSRRATMAQNPDFQWHQQMSIEQIDQIVPARILPESASKLLTYKPAELGPDGRYDFNHTNTRLIENKYSGRQVDTPSGKTEIVYGTQLIQLIDSEQDDNTIVNFQGEDISLKELRHIYQNLLSQARTNSVDQAKKFLGKLVDGNLTEKEETKFRKKLLDTLEQSGADDSLLQFFGLDPMYNLNLPNTLNKYEQLFLAHFTKGVLNQKTAGLKLTLISDYGFNVKDEKTGEYRPLKYNPSGLSEVAMPAFTRELHNLKPGDILNAKQVLEMFGQRIPTQDKHSMIAFKVVEFLPSEYGSVGIFPKEVIELSGADFDIDSIFVERKDFYMKGDKFVPFGTATTIEGKFEEFIQDQKQNNKDFIKLIKLGVPEQEALIELQLPSTLEEFKKETKGGTITLSNATINNQLVDANIAFLTNKSMVEKGIPQTPATVKRLSDVRDKIQALKGIDTSKQANLNSPIGQFTAWKSNSTGKENVGPAANTNLARAFLYKAKVHLQRDTFRPEFNGTKYFDYSKNKDTTEARIQDTLSTILSAMTDNAKDPIAGDLNLSLTSLGPVLQLVSLGVDLYDAMLLVNQPIVKKYTEAKERTKTAIKSDADYAVRTSEIKENLFNKYKLTSSDDLSLTTKEMEEGINTIKHKDGKYLYVFFKLEEQGRYWQHLSKLLALNKGLPASFKETEKIKAAIEAFKLNSEEELPEEAPFDIRKALKGTHIENNIRLFKDIMNMSKQYFITQSSVFTKTIDEIENSIKENIRDKAAVLNDIKLDFLSYLAIDQYKKTIKRPLNQNLLTGPDSIIDQYKKIPAELKNNKLVKFLTIDNKTTVPTLIANTRIKLSGIQIEELVESFRELFNDERTNQFARNLFEYLIVKDGMQFKNNSFIKFISPFMFTQMSDSLDVLSEEAFNDKISEESANNFKDVWFRHVDNQNYIKRLEPSKSITFSEENNQVRVKSFIKDVTLPEYTYINKVLHKAVTLDKNNATYEAVSPIGNELQSPYSFKNSEEVQKNSVFKQVEVPTETKSNIVSMDIATPILENLKERFNLDYEIVNEPDADWSGQYVGDKVLINSAKMQMHTLFHEFAHPFIRIVRKTNKPLWNSLVREIHETKDGKKGLDIVKQSYPELDETTQIEETIVQFIGRYAAKNIDKTTGQRLIDLIKEVLKNIAEFLGITVNPSTLAKMSLKELGALMASEAKIDISTAQQYIEPGEISQEKINISESVFKEEVEPKNEITQLADKVKLFLEKKLAIIKNKQIDNKKLKENQIKRVLEEIKDLEGVKTINVFVEDSYQKIKQAEEQFDNLIKNKENLSRHEMISRLSSFNDFANGYSVLDEISKADIEEYFSNPIKGLKEEGTFTVQDKLSYAIMARDKIKQRYLKQGIPLLADYLLEQKSTTLNVKIQKEIDQLNKRIKAIQIGNLSSDKKEEKIGEIQDRISDLSVTSIDKKTLIKQLQLASKDEGAIDYLFSPLISSDDSVLALFAKSIKNELEEARLKDIKFAEKAEKAYTEYSKTATNTNNVAKFNEGLYEELEIPVGKDGDGNTIFIKKMGFVQKYDVTKFEKAKDEFFKKLGEKPTNKQKLNEWNISVAKWFNENTSPKNQNEINTILAEKEAELKNGIITKEEHQEWLNKVINEFNGKITYKQELTQPSNKYLNPKWSKLYSEDGIPISEKGKYHKFLLDSYLESQSIVPENFRRGYILPSIQKESIERAQTTGIKNVIKTKLKESAFRQSYDTEYGLAGLTEKDAKFLPVFFTQSMDSDTVSLDLISSIMKYSAMANKYQALNNINGEIALTKAVVGERSTIETNSKGQQIMDAFAKKMGYEEYIRKNGESFSQKHLDAFIDMIVYGEMQKAEEILGLDAGKLVNTFTGFSAITTIAVDLLKGVANNLQGNIQNRIEAASKEYFDKRSLTKGTLYYTKSVPSFLSDFGKISPKTLPSKLIELYDALQGKFRDEYGREVSGTLAKKLFTTNTLFFNQNTAEHEIQGSTLFAILDYTKVKEKTGNQISLLEAYEKYGIDGIYENTNFTETKRKELQNSLHALNKRTQGVYNDFDKGTAQRYALGRLAIMYRKHLIPGYKRRFKKLSGDQELGGITEGYYRTFWNTFAKDLLSLQFNILNNWSTYTDFEKTQIRKTITEASFVLALTVLVAILKGAGDDDKKLKKSYLYNFLLYEASRMRSETAAYISPKDAYRVVKSPSAMTSTLDRGIKLTDQLLFTWDPDKLNYKRKTGVWNKGDNKSWAYFLKLLGYSGYNITPEEAVKSFEGSLNK